VSKVLLDNVSGYVPFGLIHGYKARHEADAETGKDSTDDEEGDGSRSGLHGHADGEYETGKDDTPFPSEMVASWGAE
jgi:hypothetical protein